VSIEIHRVVIRVPAILTGPDIANIHKIPTAIIIDKTIIVIVDAIQSRASDIHIEPDKSGTRIRYRIDGTLRDLMKPPTGLHQSIVSRVKVIGRMDIAEKRLPQDGRIKIRTSCENRKKEIDFRVSTLVSQDIVYRVLEKHFVSAWNYDTEVNFIHLPDYSFVLLDTTIQYVFGIHIL
jgi:type II secretory ATPase GspE/PulE/Tfp pilus assembly ATPase PilB-like protein